MNKSMENKLKMTEFLDQFEDLMFERGCKSLCGVDEVGRGPLAGPVVAAALIMPAGITIDGLDDSKKLTPQKREEIFDEIIRLDLKCAIGIIDHEMIDQMNIHKASLRAMHKAVMDLKEAPEIILVDGKHTIPNLSQAQYAIVKGDSRCKSIAAASIIAKVTRDRIMEKYEAIYPSFTFATHKGYPTPKHLEELREHSPCEIHRRSFRPVAELIDQLSLF